MTLPHQDTVKQQLTELLRSSFATNQTSMFELRGLMGPFVDLVGEPEGGHYTAEARSAIQHAADDFSSMLYAMMISEDLSKNKNTEDPRRTALEARAVTIVFFLDIRSIFDYMLKATLVVFSRAMTQVKGTFSTKWLNGQLARPNFTNFLNDVRDNDALARSAFGNDLVDLWLNCLWYEPFNDLRNGLTHNGYFLGVNDTDVDCFIVETLDGQFPLQGLMYPALIKSDNSCQFSILSGIYGGLMVYLLNNWASALLTRCTLARANRAYGGRGATTCEKNLKQALALL